MIFEDEPSPGGPPYVDTFENYKTYFYNGVLEIKKFEAAGNSIKPRAGREIFIEMGKRET